MTKRFFDLFFSLSGIIILLPLGIIISLLIIFDCGFPVFFIQNRVGRYGKIFHLIKFRTMRTKKTSKYGSFDAGNNSRVTTSGKILRKTKLDELPQLINVFWGDMSFIGPRPEVEKWVSIYPDRWSVVLSVKPGITDNASILFRNEEEILSQSANPEECYKNKILPTKLTHYEQYTINQSFWGDIVILIKTIIAVVTK